jgi:hypothetical protein
VTLLLHDAGLCAALAERGVTGAREIRVLSVNQPWASLIACGAKEWETRSWRTSYRGLVLVHASRTTVGLRAIDAAALWPAKDLPAISGHMRDAGLPSTSAAAAHELPFGKLLALAVLEQVLPTGPGVEPFPEWSERELALGNFDAGRFAWRLRVLATLPEPLAYRGGQGFPNLPKAWWPRLASALVPVIRRAS